MKTRGLIQRIFRKKDYQKVIDLIEGKEEVVDTNTGEKFNLLSGEKQEQKKTQFKNKKRMRSIKRVAAKTEKKIKRIKNNKKSYQIRIGRLGMPGETTSDEDTNLSKISKTPQKKRTRSAGKENNQPNSKKEESSSKKSSKIEMSEFPKEFAIDEIRLSPSRSSSKSLNKLNLTSDEKVDVAKTKNKTKISKQKSKCLKKRKVNGENNNLTNEKSLNESNDDTPQGDIKIDRVKRIMGAQIIDTKDLELSCNLEFEQRSDGVTPAPRRYSSKIVRYYAPQSLIDFYQSRVCFNQKNG